MDLTCGSLIHHCDDMMETLFDEDSGLGMDFDFRNDGTLSPMKFTAPLLRKHKKNRFSPDIGTYSRQSEDFKSSIKAESSADTLLCSGNVIGDGSRVCGLPTVFDSRHDLKCISPETLSDVITGACNIGRYAVIDCRYPYEYNGGHVINAENLYYTDSIAKLLTGNTSGSPPVLIFHCEFSIERGPAMCRHLRQKDREANADNYPHLYYPEIYLLQGGYKHFYEMFPELCTPEGYTPMLHKKHTQDLRHFRCKSKSWSVGQTSKPKKQTRLFDL